MAALFCRIYSICILNPYLTAIIVIDLACSWDLIVIPAPSGHIDPKIGRFAHRLVAAKGKSPHKDNFPTDLAQRRNGKCIRLINREIFVLDKIVYGFGYVFHLAAALMVDLKDYCFTWICLQKIGRFLKHILQAQF